MVGRSPPPTARLPKATPPDCEGPAVETVHRLRASDPRPNPVVPLVDSPGFLSDSSRFDRDFLGTEHARREQASRHDKVGVFMKLPDSMHMPSAGSYDPGTSCMAGPMGACTGRSTCSGPCQAICSRVYRGTGKIPAAQWGSKVKPKRRQL